MFGGVVGVAALAKAAGLTNVNLDGTVIRTDHASAPGPNGADLWGSGKRSTMVETHRSSPPRTAGRAGHADPGRPRLRKHRRQFPSPRQETRQSALTAEQQAYNTVICGIHGVCERANSLLKTTFKALRMVSLDPSGITWIARAALVLLQLEHGRTA